MLYPIKADSAGNWGTINVGVKSNSTATLGDQIRNGITEAQAKAEFPDGGKMLDKVDASTNPPTPYHTFSGDPGISAGIKDDLASLIGKPVTIPVYDRQSGNGNNASYRVVAYAHARLLEVDFKGNPKYVIVQPAPPSDPNVRDAAVTGWGNASSVTLHLSH
jgi:hypothetical protein